MEAALEDWTAQTLRVLADGRTDLAGAEALAVEASHRRFYRLHLSDGRSLVVMSSPPALENNAQFTVLARLFREHGIGVPEILARDDARGFFLLSDLGDRHFADVYDDPGPQAVLPAALDTLHRLQAIDDPRIPPYTRQRFEDELGIYVEWFLHAWLSQTTSPSLVAAFAVLVEATQTPPRCCVHRDFHSRNLLLTPTGDVGVVDFQDALMGPATYDLASLLRDCYYCLPEPQVARWCQAYLESTSLEVDPAGFARALDLTALQRQLKAVGIFVRLHLRDGRDSHLAHVLPVLERIGALAAGYPELDALAAHTAAVLPAARHRLAGWS